MKIAIIQHAPVFLNLVASLEKASKLITEAAKDGAELIAFPETWLPGYPVWLDIAPNAAKWNYKPAKDLYRLLFDNSLDVQSPEFYNLLKQIKKLKTNVVLSANEREGKTIYNSQIFINSDGEFKLHRKLMPTYTEKLVWGMGDGSGIQVMESKYGNIGGLICWEHWMPLLKAAMYSKNEIAHVAQWPSVNDLHLLASRNYAFEGKCFVMAAGTILKKQQVLDGYKSLKINNNGALDLLKSIDSDNNDFLQNGGSCVIGPDAILLTDQIFEKELTIHYDIDLDLFKENILTHDSDGHYSRPDIFSLRINTKKMSNIEFGSDNF